MTENKESHSVLFWRPAYFVLWFGLAFVAYLTFSQLTMMLVCVVAAITLAAAIAPVARYLEQRKIPRAVTILGIYAIVVILYILVGVKLVDFAHDQAELLKTSVENNLHNLKDIILHLNPKLTPENIPPIVEQLKSELMHSSGDLASSALKATKNVMTFLVNSFFVLFLTAYFVVEAPHLTQSILSWLPKDKRERVKTLLPGIEIRLGGYVRGQLLVSLAVGTIIGLGLAIVGIPGAMVLGVMAGFLNLVPFVGSLATAIIAIAIGFLQSPETGGLVILVFVIEQWLESNFIVPHLLGKQVDMHPLVVLFSVLIGSTLMGLSGALIAVPLATVALYLGEELYQKKLD